VASKTIGEEQLKTFVSKRLDTNEQSFWDTLPHMNIKTFSSMAKKTMQSTKDKTATLTADRDIFGRLLVVAKTRDVNLKDVMGYELSSVPFALAHSDGTLRKNTKSELLAELEATVKTLPASPLSDSHHLTACVTDAMAIVHMLKSTGAKTFGELADKYYDTITAPFQRSGCNRVDVVFDRYDRPTSIKAAERLRRGAFTSLEISISGPSTPLPKQWEKYIKNPRNKANLSEFLCERWSCSGKEQLALGQQLVLGGGFKGGKECKLVTRGQVVQMPALESDHEEADTRLVLHAHHASSDHSQVIVQSPDTDVAVICMHTYTSMKCKELWLLTGVKEKRRYIPIHKIVSEVGPGICKALPALHALTGCDTTSSLSGIGKKTAIRKLLKAKDHQRDISHLGDVIPPTADTVHACEKFLCSLYTSWDAAGNTANEVRYWMFCQKRQKSESLPPTSDSLHFHISRANYQCLIWKRSLDAQQRLPEPDGNGWQITDDGLQPLLMSKDPAPTGLLELISCKCQKSACQRIHACACKRNDMPCTEACLCMGGEGCRNPCKLSSGQSDDEDDDDNEH
jgi:hypothetical protein